VNIQKHVRTNILHAHLASSRYVLRCRGSVRKNASTCAAN
jgi:hypothetical protein